MADRRNNHVRVGQSTAAILAGDEDVSQWDDEELIRGQRRNKNGRWGGRPPKVVPTAVHKELTRRRMSEAYRLLQSNLVEATNVLIDLATDPDVESSVRLKAATTIMERVMGKTPERVELSAVERKPWEDAVQGGIVRIPRAAIEATATDDADDLASDDDDG